MRVVLAPVTRCRALNYAPQPAHIEFYSDRATRGGLLITEAVAISQAGIGFPHSPGIWCEEQVEAWKKVVEAVHKKGGVIFCQLWHVGRASHTLYQPEGCMPVSSTAERVPKECSIRLPDGVMAEYAQPQALDITEIPLIVEEFRQAAMNAHRAGFDGIEIHAGHGYLVDQFFKDGINVWTEGGRGRRHICILMHKPAEGIFRINAENSQEEHVRDQLNKGNIPTNIDVHCLAGLIKAWLCELPRGVLDSLPPDQLLQCNSEEECLALVKMLPSTQATLLDWAVNLMADVVQQEKANKMNARKIAMVFAPNMTQMSDPLTALMHAVQVMNFLKTLILKVLQDRQAPLKGCKPASTSGLGLPNANWQERLFGTSKLNRKDKSGDKLAHDNEPLLAENDTERKGGGSMDQDKCTVNVEERFFRGFSGRDTAEDYISSNRLALSSVHASVF